MVVQLLGYLCLARQRLNHYIIEHIGCKVAVIIVITTHPQSQNVVCEGISVFSQQNVICAAAPNVISSENNLVHRGLAGYVIDYFSRILITSVKVLVGYKNKKVRVIAKCFDFVVNLDYFFIKIILPIVGDNYLFLV